MSYYRTFHYICSHACSLHDTHGPACNIWLLRSMGGFEFHQTHGPSRTLSDFSHGSYRLLRCLLRSRAPSRAFVRPACAARTPGSHRRRSPENTCLRPGSPASRHRRRQRSQSFSAKIQMPRCLRRGGISRRRSGSLPGPDREPVGSSNVGDAAGMRAPWVSPPRSASCRRLLELSPKEHPWSGRRCSDLDMTPCRKKRCSAR
ncbi:hypothetical protein OBBRIDRAFT_467697 [Obba rivulosa]|uniref:Uncharacterized protein n=1 Tax=Obba rivulosa TaxID=1052685 RepID=A0A8E2DN79_9APHY|nr:hypothetical protein OBBRIDRAFT_467697 [Obba rivulosa]